MIISRTPFRMSFVGGGTDLELYYSKEDGRVLSTTIDKYIYVVVKRQVAVVEHKYRINWSTVEFKNRIEDIEHPIVREALKLMEIDFPIEITTFADIPANTGLGSSSSFTVGLLHALFALKGQMVKKSELAAMASKIEIDILGRRIGKQDHYAATYGNLNIFTFHPNHSVSVDPVFYKDEVRNAIQDRLMLFYTQIKRNASDVLSVQQKSMDRKHQVLTEMKNLVPQLGEVINERRELNEFGQILHRGWLLKKSISEEVSSTNIDEYYQKAMNAGALGGKLLGAGGGGFLVFSVSPENQEAVKKALSNVYQLPFKFENSGTRITYYD
ncbi:MAG: GHMP kinase [Nitrospinae bacterium]|nr:GHMP kinase [Nitrospinota bacterium]